DREIDLDRQFDVTASQQFCCSLVSTLDLGQPTCGLRRGLAWRGRGDGYLDCIHCSQVLVTRTGVADCSTTALQTKPWKRRTCNPAQQGHRFPRSGFSFHAGFSVDERVVRLIAVPAVTPSRRRSLMVAVTACRPGCSGGKPLTCSSSW